jgi:hypothetical protein
MHYSLRVATRAFQAVNPMGAAQRPATRMLAGVFAGWDVALGRALRAGRIGYPTRLAFDALDVAVWTGAEREASSYTAALLPACPALVELGYDLGGRRAVAAAALPFLSSAAVRVLLKRRVAAANVIWPALAVGAGVLLRQLEDRAIARRKADEELSIGALERAAADRGRVRAVQDLAVTHDQVQHSLYVLQTAAAEELRARISAHKHEYFASRTNVSLLVTSALDDYSALRRALSPVLDAQVWFDHEPGAEDVLLVPMQVESLFSALDDIAVRGPVRTYVVATGPAGEPRLRVGDWLITLPPTSRSAWRIDLSVGGLVVQGAHTLTMLDPAVGAVHPAVTVASTCLSWGAAAVGEALLRRGLAVRPFVVESGAAGAVMHGVGATLAMRRPFEANGAARYPGPTGFTWWAVNAVVHWDTLPPATRRRIAATATAGLVASWFAAPEPRQPNAFLTEMLWAGAAVVGARALASDVRERSAAVRAELDRAAGDRVEAAREAARDAEFAYAAELLAVSERLLTTVDDPDRVAAIRRNLDTARAGYDDAARRAGRNGFDR